MTLGELKQLIDKQPEFALDDNLKIRMYPRRFRNLFEAALDRCPDDEDYEDFDVLDCDPSYGTKEFIIEI